MAFTPIPALPSDLLIAAEYSPDGTSWAKLRDHQVLAWMCDVGAAPVPVIIGTTPALTAKPPGGGLTGTPYVLRRGQAYVTPDGVTRGTSLDMFTQLSASGCQLYGNFFDNALAAEFRAWGEANPGLYLTEDPEVTAQRAALALAEAQAARERAEAIEAQAKAEAARAASQARSTKASKEA
jgi:hypothetical protein